jgi:hypothetical protein
MAVVGVKLFKRRKRGIFVVVRSKTIQVPSGAASSGRETEYSRRPVSGSLPAFSIQHLALSLSPAFPAISPNCQADTGGDGGYCQLSTVNSQFSVSPCPLSIAHCVSCFCTTCYDYSIEKMPKISRFFSGQIALEKIKIKKPAPKTFGVAVAKFPEFGIAKCKLFLRN